MSCLDDLPVMGACGTMDCADPAAFWVYDQPSDRWSPVCRRHLVEHHPSLEVHAWLTSGFARPIETSPPNGIVDDVPQRTIAFRDIVMSAMGWEVGDE